MAYVYRHIRIDKNEPFYIGIGSDKNYNRAFEIKPKRRNIIWNKIKNKTDIEIQIVLDNLTWYEACIKEKEFIKLYGRIDCKNGILSNLTDGGDGNLGYIMSNDRKKIMSEKFTGSGNPMYKKTHSKDILEKIRLKNIGRIPWNKNKIIGKNEKLSISKKGCNAWNKGLKNVNGLSLSKIVLNIENGIYYQSCKEASIIYGYKHSTLKSKLNGTNKNNTNLIYV